MNRYRFDPEALREYESAIDWYADHSIVAPKFIVAIEETIRKIRRTPAAFARWPGIGEQEVRRAVVRRFPFVVVYRVERDGLLIAAITHTSREPGYWLDRLKR